jgi:hypothetical protein
MATKSKMTVNKRRKQKAVQHMMALLCRTQTILTQHRQFHRRVVFEWIFVVVLFMLVLVVVLAAVSPPVTTRSSPCAQVFVMGTQVLGVRAGRHRHSCVRTMIVACAQE